jgi:hypothetical protein
LPSSVGLKGWEDIDIVGHRLKDRELSARGQILSALAPEERAPRTHSRQSAAWAGGAAAPGSRRGGNSARSCFLSMQERPGDFNRRPLPSQSLRSIARVEGRLSSRERRSTSSLRAAPDSGPSATPSQGAPHSWGRTPSADPLPRCQDCGGGGPGLVRG